MRRVLPPETTFEQIAAQLSAAGWQRAHVLGLRPPLRPGEPELARFERDARRLTYSYNPVIGLRVLDGDLDTTLTGVARAEVERWLASDDPRTAARGCAAAAELDLHALSGAVSATASHLPDALKPLGQAARQRLSPLPAGRPGGLFDVLPVAMRLQLLRHMLHDDPAAAAVMVPTCWSDGAELAATAMIAAARLDLTDQGLAIQRADLSDLWRTHREREVFTALKKACLATLQGQRPTSEDTAKNAFWRLVLGLAPPPDDTGLLIHALTTPIPDVPPSDPPDGFCTVPAVAHWLGHDSTKGWPNPRRLWTPPQPYTIRSAPMTPVSGPDIAHALGTAERLPSLDEWEAAMRGPDGRPYPWGLGRTHPAVAMSPWGALWSAQPEWADSGGTLVLCGSDPNGYVAFVVAAAPDSQAAVRGVLIDR